MGEWMGLTEEKNLETCQTQKKEGKCSEFKPRPEHSLQWGMRSLGLRPPTNRLHGIPTCRHTTGRRGAKWPEVSPHRVAASDTSWWVLRRTRENAQKMPLRREGKHQTSHCMTKKTARKCIRNVGQKMGKYQNRQGHKHQEDSQRGVRREKTNAIFQT